MTKIKLFSISLLILFCGGNASSQNFGQPTNVGQLQNQIKVAYINSTELLNNFPERAEATSQLLLLSKNYKNELELMESEYNKKYSDYITYQSSLSENIKLRRMQELTELESRMQEFMELAQKDIEYQEKEMLEPLKDLIYEAVQAVGIERNYTVIYDLADSGIAFVTPLAENANSFVIQKLNRR